MATAPAFQFYAADFSTSTAEFSPAGCGLLIKGLAQQWILGSLPAAPAALARVLGVLPQELAASWEEVAHLFPEGDDGRLRNRRLEKVRADQEKYRERQTEKAKRGAAARWGKQPPETKRKNAGRNAAGNAPSSSSSSSPSSSSPPLPPQGENEVEKYVELAARRGLVKSIPGLTQHINSKGGLAEDGRRQLREWLEEEQEKERRAVAEHRQAERREEQEKERREALEAAWATFQVLPEDRRAKIIQEFRFSGAGLPEWRRDPDFNLSSPIVLSSLKNWLPGKIKEYMQ